MKHLLCMLFACASYWSYGQMIPGQSVKLEYDPLGNRVVREPYTGGNQNKKGEEKAEGSQATLYPNPATDHISIIMEEADSVQIDISMFDISGKPVLSDRIQAGSKTRTLPLSQLAPGTYQITITTSKGTETKSFIHL